MSCRRNQNRISATAAIKSGISTATSKAGNVIGATADALAKTEDTLNDQLVRRVAPASNAVLRAVDRPAIMTAKVAPAVIAVVASAVAAYQFQVGLTGRLGEIDQRGLPGADEGGLVTRPAKVTKPMLALGLKVEPRAAWLPGAAEDQPVVDTAKAVKGVATETKRAIAKVGTVTGVAGALASGVAASVAKSKDGQRTLELKKNGKTMATVEFSKAESLTQFLNRTALIGSHRRGQNIVASDGDVVRHGMNAWHRGTTVVKTPQGQRTITHLQSLRLPTQRYYFDRKLSNEEVAGVITGREKASRMKGYVGEIHPTESLTPGWGAAKKAMITARLYHPSPEAEWQTKT